jgi:hypothetical protein
MCCASSLCSSLLVALCAPIATFALLTTSCCALITMFARSLYRSIAALYRSMFARSIVANAPVTPLYSLRSLSLRLVSLRSTALFIRCAHYLIASLCTKCAHYIAALYVRLLISLRSSLAHCIAALTCAWLTRACALVELRSACYFWSKAPKKYPAVGLKPTVFVKKYPAVSGLQP